MPSAPTYRRYRAPAKTPKQPIDRKRPPLPAAGPGAIDCSAPIPAAQAGPGPMVLRSLRDGLYSLYQYKTHSLEGKTGRKPAADEDEVTT